MTSALVAEHDALDDPDGFAPDAWAASLAELIERLARLRCWPPAASAATRSWRPRSAPGSSSRWPPTASRPRAADGAGALVTRMRWGGSLLEEAALEGAPVLLTSRRTRSRRRRVEVRGKSAVERFARDALEPGDRHVAVVERVAARTGGVSLTDATVVVSGGRGVGSTEGFAAIEELAALLGGAVGCSRAVTMAGWRPHSDQVGQTGTKIAPELYIACGISGATQHMAGCKGAKRLLAINPDAEAPILASADYAVIGDLHTVVPAINAAIRKARET